MNTLKNIFEEHSNEVSGKITKVNWDYSVEEINKYLKYTGDPYVGLGVVSEIEHEKRKNAFWKFVSFSIELPPQKIFKHESDNLGYFTDYSMWGFCYIFLSNGKGIVVYLHAYD